MKALEILKAVEDEGIRILFKDGSFYKTEYIQEAIAELEELLKPKTCDGLNNQMPLYDITDFWFGDTYQSKDGITYINTISIYDLRRIKLGVYLIKREYESFDESLIKYQEYSGRQKRMSEPNESITQFKTLQAPKACESCSHRLDPNRQFQSFSCALLKRHVRNDFYCADYEPKDNA